MNRLSQVKPLTPLAPYIGGKRNLAKAVIRRIDATPHDCYAEVFVGMAGVFLRRHLAPKSEVINDWSRDVSTFFRVLQRHYVAFIDMMRFQLTTRAEFERLCATDPDTLTDLERAARFLYLQNTAFGGKVNGRSFGVSYGRPARFDVTRLGPMLEEVHARLARVVVERLPYDAFVTRYDRPGTLFYLDPPYWGNEGDYGVGMFARRDFLRLAALLHQIEGRFILSINDVPEVRSLFAAFDIEPVETTYTLSDKGSKRAGELIISGGGGSPGCARRMRSRSAWRSRRFPAINGRASWWRCSTPLRASAAMSWNAPSRRSPGRFISTPASRLGGDLSRRLRAA